MSHRLTHLFVLVMLLFTGTMLLPNTARAANNSLACTASIDAINFGDIDPTSARNVDVLATLSWSCSETNNSGRTATICLYIGNGPLGLSSGMRQISGPGGNLGFQVYSDANRGTLWGSAYSNGVSRSFAISNSSRATGTISVYTRLFGNQNFATVGTYSSTFTTPDFQITGVINGDGNSNDCNGAAPVGSFDPVTITATIIKSCTVSAGSTLNLGSVVPTATDMTGSNTINVACTNGTPYYVGLSPSNGNTTGSGLMKGTGNNPDLVPYQLRSTAGLAGTIWGNTVTSTNKGNGVDGNGNGSPQLVTVYATVPSANYRPDDYSDTVTVNVNY